MNDVWRTVRIFISSTFRDMQAERDHLVRFVFPQLREALVEHQIHLVDVDLRWGVTSDQDVVMVCQEIIDECKPRFIGILGGRYGWTAPGHPSQLQRKKSTMEFSCSRKTKHVRFSTFDQTTPPILSRNLNGQFTQKSRARFRQTSFGR